jgi:hypothetical protein
MLDRLPMDFRARIVYDSSWPNPIALDDAVLYSIYDVVMDTQRAI